MSTRGAYGYRADREDKVTYNHCDSYPAALGAKIFEYVAKTDLDSMRNVAWHIKLVNRNSIPSTELIARYKKYADIAVSDRSYKDWYCLLRKTQGSLYAHHQDLEHMIDSREFLYDSLFCEWAYIIDLDTQNLEIYRGFNRSSRAEGRYAPRHVPDCRGYYGVRLVAEFPFGLIRNSDVEDLVALAQVANGARRQKTLLAQAEKKKRKRNN